VSAFLPQEDNFPLVRTQKDKQTNKDFPYSVGTAVFVNRPETREYFLFIPNCLKAT
jgi:hypothetical protein